MPATPALSLLHRRDSLRGVKRTVLCGLAIVGAVLLSDCGGNNDNKDNNGNGDKPPSQSPPPPGGGSTIRGGERLTWDQIAASITDLRSLTFRLYVDGQASTLSATRCNEAGRGTSFECSGLLPAMFSGQHTLQLTSVLDGVESFRSPGLLVTVVGGAPPPPPPPPPPPRDILSPEHSAFENSTICSDEPRKDCYGVQLIAGDLGAVTALSPLPDGRVMFIEAGRQVRIIGGATNATAVALSAERNRQLTGLAIDTQFDTSRSVFVAWTELARGVPVLNITRYRELGNMLGEGATVVTGLPVTSDSPTPLAVDDEGLIYVAVPANRNASGSRFPGNAGAVMRFNRDGRVPSANQHVSPIVATGYSTPLALAIDRSTRTVWLTGRDDRDVGEVAVLGIPALSRGTWPSQPSAVERPLNGGTQVESIAIDETASARSTEVQIVIATEGELRSVYLEHGAVTRSSDLHLGTGYFAKAVAIDRAGALYVGAAASRGGAMLKLTRVLP
jgi:glucose/sorbosone dehydrogenase